MSAEYTIEQGDQQRGPPIFLPAQPQQLYDPSWQTRTDETINNILEAIGWYYKEKEDDYVTTLKTPMLNKQGAMELKLYLRGLVHKDIILSNFEREEAKEWLKGVLKGLMIKLVFNCTAWETNIINIDTIGRVAEANLWATINRAIGGRERETIKEQRVVTVTGQLSEAQSQPIKRGLPFKLPFIGGRK